MSSTLYARDPITKAYKELSCFEVGGAGTGIWAVYTSTGSGGGSGGDASAANQTSQIALETAIRDRLPAAFGGAGGVKVELLSSIALALDATTLAALENTTVSISGTPTVVLDATSLAALETINANIIGTVPVNTGLVQGLTDTQLRASAVPVSLAAAIALDAGTLAALENTTVAVSGTVTTTETPPTAISHAVVSIPTAGTRVQLAAFACKCVLIKALTTNTGNVYVGGSAVAAANGYPLAPGDTIAVDISNVNLMYVDTATNSNSVAWIANV
jgi:hypothetical protein